MVPASLDVGSEGIGSVAFGSEGAGSAFFSDVISVVGSVGAGSVVGSVAEGFWQVPFCAVQRCWFSHAALRRQSTSEAAIHVFVSF